MLRDSGRNLGIIIFFMVPAIIGGGIAYEMFHGYTAVIIFEIILATIAGAFIRN